MDCTERQTIGGQILAPLDAAMRSSRPLLFFDAVETSSNTNGRHQDATATAWMRCLYDQGEIELLMRLRTVWVCESQEVLTEAGQDAARELRVADGADSERGVAE